MDESIYFYKSFYCMDGDSNHKSATAVQSQSVAQCWKMILIGTGSLSELDVNSTDDNQPRKTPAVGSQPGSILTFQGVLLNHYSLTNRERIIHVHAQ